MMPSRANRRTVICGAAKTAAWLAIPFGPPAKGQSATTSVLRFGADPTGVADSSAAFAKAIAESSSVLVPAGTYLVDDVELRAGLTITGEGRASVIRQKPDSRYALWCDSRSASTASNIRGLRLRQFHLKGSSETLGFSEHVHLLNLNGVTNCIVEDVAFSAFRGDGIYLGSSNVHGKERHNVDVTIRRCSFDGVNRENRNAISVIDCDGLLIEDNTFVNVARPNMPGAIDFEPDNLPFHVLRKVRVAGNRFDRIGGNLAVISVFISAPLDTGPSDFVFENNEIGSANAAAFVLIQRGNTSLDKRPRGVFLRGNKVVGPLDRPFYVEGIRDLSITDNTFSNARRSALLGYRSPALPLNQVVVERNRFDQCGKEDSAALRVFSVTGVRFERNVWDESGSGAAGSSAVSFNAGESDSVAFVGNRFTSATGRTKIAIHKERNHKFSANSNVFNENTLDDRLSNQFEAPGTATR